MLKKWCYGDGTCGSTGCTHCPACGKERCTDYGNEPAHHHGKCQPTTDYKEWQKDVSDWKEKFDADFRKHQQALNDLLNGKI